VIPRTEICGGIRKPGEHGKRGAADRPNSRIEQSQPNTAMLGDPASGSTSQGKTSHVDKREKRQHSRPHPIWSEALHQGGN